MAFIDIIFHVQVKHLTSWNSVGEFQLLNTAITEITESFTGEADQSRYYKKKKKVGKSCH